MLKIKILLTSKTDSTGSPYYLKSIDGELFWFPYYEYVLDLICCSLDDMVEQQTMPRLNLPDEISTYEESESSVLGPIYHQKYSAVLFHPSHLEKIFHDTELPDISKLH